MVVHADLRVLRDTRTRSAHANGSSAMVVHADLRVLRDTRTRSVVAPNASVAPPSGASPRGDEAGAQPLFSYTGVIVARATVAPNMLKPRNAGVAVAGRSSVSTFSACTAKM